MSRPGAYGVLLFLLSSPALAFGYLEHGFLSDRACHEAQQRLASAVTADEALVARYMALALMCPARWARPYCADDYKQAEGSLHELSGPPRESGDHSVTLGDFAALADHLSDFGPVRGYPLASRRGLTRRLFGWVAAEPGDTGGVLADVGEDACETDDRVPWDDLEKDLSRRLSQAASEQGLPALSRDTLVSRPRAPVPLGQRRPRSSGCSSRPADCTSCRTTSREVICARTARRAASPRPATTTTPTTRPACSACSPPRRASAGSSRGATPTCSVR